MSLLEPGLILVAVLLYGALHSWLASLSLKSLLQRRLGALAGRVYRIIYNLWAVASFLPVLALVAWLPDRLLYTLPAPWWLVAFALQGVALVVLVAGLLQTDLGSFLGMKQLFNPPGAAQEELVVGGLYRWVRHPLYTAGLALIWLLPWMTANLLALNLGLTLYILAGAWLEERKLMAEFGEVYRVYRQHTPMFFPCLWCPAPPDGR